MLRLNIVDQRYRENEHCGHLGSHLATRLNATGVFTVEQQRIKNTFDNRTARSPYRAGAGNDWYGVHVYEYSMTGVIYLCLSRKTGRKHVIFLRSSFLCHLGRNDVEAFENKNGEYACKRSTPFRRSQKGQKA